MFRYRVITRNVKGHWPFEHGVKNWTWSDLNKWCLKLFVWSQVFQKWQFVPAYTYKNGVMSHFVLYINTAKMGHTCIWAQNWIWSVFNISHLNLFVWSQVFQKWHFLAALPYKNGACLILCYIYQHNKMGHNCIWVINWTWLNLNKWCLTLFVSLQGCKNVILAAYTYTFGALPPLYRTTQNGA